MFGRSGRGNGGGAGGCFLRQEVEQSLVVDLHVGDVHPVPPTAPAVPLSENRVNGARNDAHFFRVRGGSVVNGRWLFEATQASLHGERLPRPGLSVDEHGAVVTVEHLANHGRDRLTIDAGLAGAGS